jgi:probable rRNA maturation factor
LVTFKKRIRGLSEIALARFVARAKRAIRLGGAVNLLVTSSRELRRLNRQFRGKDTPTDVLSFPAIYGRNGGLTGDVAISADIAAYNARRLGHTAAEEIKILALHGVLHLAGYDHERDRGEMAIKEARLRRGLALPAGLIERNGSRKGKGNRLTVKNAKLARRTRRKTRARLTRVSR